MEVMTPGAFQPIEAAVVKEGGLQGDVAQRRGAELVAVVRIAGKLFEAEVRVLTRAIEDHITLGGGDLRNSEDVLREVAKHFIRRSRYRMTFLVEQFGASEFGIWLGRLARL